MAKINWTFEAELWLKDIHDFIAKDNPNAATRVVSGIYKKAQVLKKFPEIGYKGDKNGKNNHISKNRESN